MNEKLFEAHETYGKHKDSELELVNVCSCGAIMMHGKRLLPEDIPTPHHINLLSTLNAIEDYRKFHHEHPEKFKKEDR